MRREPERRAQAHRAAAHNDHRMTLPLDTIAQCRHHGLVRAAPDQVELAGRVRQVGMRRRVQTDGNVEVLARGPEGVINGVAEREIVHVGGRPYEYALKPELPHRPAGFQGLSRLRQNVF